MPQVLALDFDGVISDSLLEAYLLTWRIAGKIEPQLAVAGGRVPGLDNIHSFRDQHREHWESFSRLVPFGNRAEDYLVIQRAVQLGKSFGTQEEFNSFCKTLDPRQMDDFHEEFYRERYRLAEHHREGWIALNKPYPGIRKAIEALSSYFELAVATSKDSQTVHALLDSYGLGSLFGPSHVLDKSMGGSKRAHLATLRDIFNCTYGEMTFIDDKVAHLIDCSDLGVRLFMAGWGYNSTQEAELAASQNIPVLQIEELASLSPR